MKHTVKTAKEIIQEKLGKKVVFSFGGNMTMMESLNANELVEIVEAYHAQFELPVEETKDAKECYVERQCISCMPKLPPKGYAQDYLTNADEEFKKKQMVSDKHYQEYASLKVKESNKALLEELKEEIEALDEGLQIAYSTRPMMVYDKAVSATYTQAIELIDNKLKSI